VVFIALVVGHIFLAVFFVRGTLSGMTRGQVDANWAKEHHDRWYTEVQGDSEENRAP
jgi:formate dehydrogenase subunit gamma